MYLSNCLFNAVSYTDLSGTLIVFIRKVISVCNLVSCPIGLELWFRTFYEKVPWEVVAGKVVVIMSGYCIAQLDIWVENK